MRKPVLIVFLICAASALLIYFLNRDGDTEPRGALVQPEEEKPQGSPGGKPPPDFDEARFPKIVPVLDCVPSPKDGQGTAVLSPSTPLQIGSVETFEITFTVGEAGITPGGFILLQVSPWWGWTEPQSYYPGRPGYTEVTPSFEDPALKIFTLQLSRILVYSEKRALEPGDQVTFRYGPARVDKFAEGEELFQVFVDGDGDGHYGCIKNPPALSILPYHAARLAVHCPSRGAPGEEIEIKAAPLDPLGNWSNLPAGCFSMKVLGSEGGGSAMEQDAAGGEKTLAFRYTLPGEGAYFFEVEGPGSLEGSSNVLLCREGAPTVNLYFGDIHGHSRLSDGTGTPEDYYRFAREVSGLDLAALTDHGDFGTIRVEGEVWERIKRAANNAYEPGCFATLVGFEWTNWEYGHRNVYYRDGDGPVFRSMDGASDTPQELWQLLEPFEAMTVAHHVGGGPIRTDWSIPPGPKEWLVEIASIHGSSEYYGGEACIYRPVEGAFVRDALARGYRLGIIASGDTHDGHPGQRSAGSVVNGTVAVFAPELTREALWEAFRKRHVYGTSGPKIILFFRVANSPMGSEVTWPEAKGPVPIAVMTVACGEIEKVEIIRNGDVVYRDAPDPQGIMAQFLIEDQEPLKGLSWYYARVVQKDGNMAWSSPVWVNR